MIIPKMGVKELYRKLKKINPEVKFLFTRDYTSCGFYKKYDVDAAVHI